MVTSFVAYYADLSEQRFADQTAFDDPDVVNARAMSYLKKAQFIFNFLTFHTWKLKPSCNGHFTDCAIQSEVFHKDVKKYE